MAGRGAPPKGEDKRQRRNADAIGWTDVDPDARAIDPPALPGADDFSPATLSWYRTWCESPQASTFIATDWQRLHMLATLVEKFHGGRVDLMAEIRLNEASLGATVVDRQRARMALKKSAPAAATGGEATASRRQADPRKLQVVK